MRAPALLCLLLIATLARAEDQAARRAAVEGALGKAATAISARADHGVTASESALLLRASALLHGDDRERARDALVRAWDGTLERPQDPDAAAAAADADRLEGLLDAWQASGDERFRQAANEALGRAAVDAAKASASPDLAALATALARAGAVLATPEATAMARRAWRAVAAGLNEKPDPVRYAALAHATLTLYECAGDIEALRTAIDARDALDRAAWDEAAGTYKTTAPFAAVDSVILARVTDDDAVAARAKRLLATVGDEPQLLIAAAEDAAPVLHLTLIGRGDEPGTATLLAAAHRRCVPGFAITTLDEGEVTRALRQRFRGMPLMPREGGAPTAYLCTESACDEPTADPEKLAKRIAELAAR
jgi:uncharacterized protein YyaL (SSP411 family)